MLFSDWSRDANADAGYGPFDATNALKHLINQSEERILQIDQSKNASKHL